ncbi:MAG: prohibitin family protein [Rhodothermaceae bacterium]
MFLIISAVAAVITFMMFSYAKKNGKKQEATFAILACVVSIAIGAFQFVTVIPAGTVGVVDFFGNVSDNTLAPGVNVVNPLASIHKFDQKTQTITTQMGVPSKEGLNVQLDISLLFRIDEGKANMIYKTVGPNYIDKIIIPKFRSIVRDVTAKYEAKALYTSSRDELSNSIMKGLDKEISARGIIIESAELRSIQLPPRLKESIEEKLKAEQESQKMAFVLQKEKQEAERKKIEARGIADFQKIVAQGISNQYLKWKGIEATEKLASSPNSKVIVIGSGKDGLPIILGGNN